MSQEVLKSELDLFKSSSFQGSIISSQFVPFRPVSSIADAKCIEFNITAFPDEYLDLQNLFYWIKAKVTQLDGTDFPANQKDRYSIINYSGNTIWEQLDLKIGNTLISQSSNTYPYRSLIDLLTTQNELSMNTHLRSAGFTKISDAPDTVDPTLSKLIGDSKEFSLYGRLHSDIFNSDRLLLNGVSMNITFTKGSDEFNFLAAAAHTPPGSSLIPQPKPKLIITDMSLFIRKVKLAPNLLAAHAKALQLTKAKYPIKRTEVKVVNLNPGISSFVLDNVWMGQMPSKLIIGLIAHDAYSGSYSLNPLAFKNHDLTYLSVQINGETHPCRPYQPNYSTDMYEREYFELFNNLGMTLSATTPNISFSQFKNSLCLYPFNFNSDFENPKENEYINLTKEGFLNIELHFQKNLTDALKVICYAQFDNTIEIDSNRNVTTDF